MVQLKGTLKKIWNSRNNKKETFLTKNIIHKKLKNFKF